MKDYEALVIWLIQPTHIMYIVRLQYTFMKLHYMHTFDGVADLSH